ncbi:MAG: glycosyltransferase family 4 protein [Geminicoccaceae bacterium]
MRIALVTDAWTPQINGVVTTLVRLVSGLRARGHEVDVIEPGAFTTVPCPSYPEIPLSLDLHQVWRRLRGAAIQRLHISTEGPLGLAARAWARVNGVPFTTSLHTRFPDYFDIRVPGTRSVGMAYLRWFHKPSRAVLVPSRSMRDSLQAEGFRHLRLWTRGFDAGLFSPAHRDPSLLPGKPHLLCVSRLAPEKNLEAFCALGDRFICTLVGDGPDRPRLEAQYPRVRYLGFQQGVALARLYASADVFVFPSRTDTFGVVMLEAMASGTPVVGYPVTGPMDVIEPGLNGWLGEDLSALIEPALTLDRKRVRASAERWSWDECVDLFEAQTPYQTDKILSRRRRGTSLLPRPSLSR